MSYSNQKKPPPEHPEIAGHIAREKKKRDGARPGHLAPMADVLQSLLQNSKSELADGFTRFRLQNEWLQVVGAELADKTGPAAFSQGVLHVWVCHPAWMQQLWYMQDAIRDKVNAHLGHKWVRMVRFTTSRRAMDFLPGDQP